MDSHIYLVCISVIACVFAVSFLLTGYRMLSGPNSLDRLISLDGLVAMVQGCLAVWMCMTLDTTVANAMLVVALLGFISTVSVTRFRKKDGEL